MNYRDKFGLLPTPVTLQFTQGIIKPLDGYEEIMHEVQNEAHHEGYLYPPTIHWERGKKESYNHNSNTYTEYEIVPNSERPSPVLILPATHSIELFEEYSRGGRQTIGAFVIQLVGFLFGVRTQFYDWRIDGRGLVKGRNDFIITAKKASECVSTSVESWNMWGEEERKRITNILYLYTKAISEEYEWLEFTLLYMVFDACYHLSNTLYSVTAKSHEDRLIEVSSNFGIVEEPELFKEWSTLRNNLFHEALWRGDHVGASSISEIYHSILYFHAYLSRVIVALLGYKTKYIGYTWKHLSMVAFD